MKDIPMISEIDISSLVDDSYYKCYPTTVHRDKDSPWLFIGADIRQIKILSEKRMNVMMWGK